MIRTALQRVMAAIGYCFGGVKHSFTNPSAADYGLDALAYDAQADRQSWHMLLWMLDDAFK